MVNKNLFLYSKFRLCVSWVLFLTSVIPAIAQQQEEKENRISGDFRHTPLVEFFTKIESQVPVKFYYKKEWFVRDSVDLTLDNKPLDAVLAGVLSGKSYAFITLNNNQYVFLPREKVAMLVGKLQNYSDKSSSDQSFIQVGKASEAGKFKSATVTGKVTDGKTREPIIGATIQVNNLQKGVITNVHGIYSLTLTPGMYTLKLSCIGYEKAEYNVKVLSNGEQDFELFDKSVALDDVVVYGQRVDRNVSSHQMSLIELDTKTIKQLPVVTGLKDILKGLTSMPGIKSIGEFSSGINVRGGGEDQNLYLLNGATLFNTSHVLGLFTVINPDAVDKLSLYKGHIPASYGERVSSVVDIRTPETPPARIRIKGGIGVFDSRLMIELPLYKDRVFLDFGARTSYSDWILQHTNDYYLENSKASFYDLNGTLHLNFGRSHISLSGYGSNDVFRFASEVRYHYGNGLASLNWNYMFTPNLASYFTLAFSRYGANKDDISTALLQSRFSSGIDCYSLKYRIKYTGIRNNSLDLGFGFDKYETHPQEIGPLNDLSLISHSTVNGEQGYEGALFLNDEFNPTGAISFNAGLRFSGYTYVGPASIAQYAPGKAKDSSSIIGFRQYSANQPIQSYFGLEPRLSARLRLDEHSSLKLSYNRNVQYLSLVSYSSVSTPSDIWKLADPYVKPMIANQVAMGYYRNFLNNSLESSVEVYYKSLDNVIEYKNGGQFEMNQHIETALLNATGKNYGVEFLLKKNSGRIDGWITYTYSRSLRKTNGTNAEDMINNNRYFPSSYDIPHDFSTVFNYHINKRAQLSANFSYMTGRPITLPEYKYYVGNDLVVLFSDKNKYRMPPYNRLDLTFRMDESLRIKKKWKGSWSFSVLNVYGRKNAYTIYYKKEDPSSLNDYNSFSLYKLYLIGKPIPVLSYSFIF